MAKRVQKDTFMYEDSGAGVMVRRQVFAGQFIPEHYVEGEDTASGAIEEEDGPPKVGLGAAPQAYKHQVGVDVKDQLKARGRKSGKADVQGTEEGGQAAAELDDEEPGSEISRTGGSRRASK